MTKHPISCYGLGGLRGLVNGLNQETLSVICINGFGWLRSFVDSLIEEALLIIVAGWIFKPWIIVSLLFFFFPFTPTIFQE